MGQELPKNTWIIDNLEGYSPLNDWLEMALKEHHIVLLTGDLGSGKTTFIGQFLRHKYHITEVSSPTYSLINLYEGQNDDGPIEVAHCDLYRMDHAEEVFDIGFEDLLDSQTPLFIEWPELIEHLIDDALVLHFQVDEKERRIIKGEKLKV